MGCGASAPAARPDAALLVKPQEPQETWTAEEKKQMQLTARAVRESKAREPPEPPSEPVASSPWGMGGVLDDPPAQPMRPMVRIDSAKIDAAVAGEYKRIEEQAAKGA